MVSAIFLKSYNFNMWKFTNVELLLLKCQRTLKKRKTRESKYKWIVKVLIINNINNVKSILWVYVRKLSEMLQGINKFANY